MPTSTITYLERHLLDRQTYKERRSAALAEWQIVKA
jgi:putative transposase